jgi:hypothetical protein
VGCFGGHVYWIIDWVVDLLVAPFSSGREPLLGDPGRTRGARGRREALYLVAALLVLLAVIVGAVVWIVRRH